MTYCSERGNDVYDAGSAENLIRVKHWSCLIKGILGHLLPGAATLYQLARQNLIMLLVKVVYHGRLRKTRSSTILEAEGRCGVRASCGYAVAEISVSGN